jgi:hypothetical protein
MAETGEIIMEIRGQYGIAYLQDCLVWMKAQADKILN